MSPYVWPALSHFWVQVFLANLIKHIFLPIPIVQSTNLYSFCISFCTHVQTMQNSVTNVHSIRSLQSFPQQPHHITLHCQTQHLPILVSLIYQFQEQFTGNTSKADSLTFFHFLLKTLLAVLTSETLTMGWPLLYGSLIFPHKQCLLFHTSCLCASSALDSLSNFNSVQ